MPSSDYGLCSVGASQRPPSASNKSPGGSSSRERLCSAILARNRCDVPGRDALSRSWPENGRAATSAALLGGFVNDDSRADEKHVSPKTADANGTTAKRLAT